MARNMLHKTCEIKTCIININKKKIAIEVL